MSRQAALTSDVPDGSAVTDATEAIVTFVSTLRYDMLGAEVHHFARRQLLDTIGMMIAGASGDAVTRTEEAIATVSRAGTVPVVGRSRGADALDAAFLGGLSAHDATTCNVADGAVVPAVLALSAMMRTNGHAVVEAIVGGGVAATSIERVLHPNLKQRGLHVAAIAGAFGAAMACGRLRGLSARRLTHAMSIAAAGTNGLFSFAADSDIARMQNGHAARNGLQAALLAERGIEGPPGVLEAQSGFLNPSSIAHAVMLQSPIRSAAGDTTAFLDDASLKDRFFNRAAPTFGATVSNALIEQIWTIEDLDDVAPLIASLAAPWD